MFTENTVLKVEQAFQKRFSQMPMPEGLEQTISQLTSDEALCLKFYYSFMPVSDIASYSVELYLQMIRQSLAVREKNLFGETLSDEIFLNFVVFGRINNENLEYNRDYFYETLYPRVANLSAKEALLEINYWSLEKLTYIGNSARTMSPFTLIKNTVGRCGEESVFTVSALRSLGIPARAIYTPLWAHSESNHAWVEAYVGGEWHFVGACEPEPVTNKGWFTGPASRGIVIQSRVFSNMPPQDEEVTFLTDTVCEINRTKAYVQNHGELHIQVVNGTPDLKVKIQIVAYCNYADILSLTPDTEGNIHLTLGKGDVRVLVTDGKKSVVQRVDTRLTTHVILDFAQASTYDEDSANGETLQYVPPVLDHQDPPYDITPEMAEAHEARTNQCHQIRKAYADTFADDIAAKALAEKYAPDHFEANQFFISAKGNLEEMVKFMDDTSLNVGVKDKYLLFKGLEVKDFTDGTADIFMEHLAYALPFKGDYYEDIYQKYILSPRIGLEMITPFRAFITDYFTQAQKQDFVAQPAKIWDWILAHITDTDGLSTGNDNRNLVTAPVGLLTYKYGSGRSLKQLFVSICRTLGIPAQINTENGNVEYYEGGQFMVVAKGEADKEVNAARVTLSLTLKEEESLNPYSNITLARFEDGAYALQNFKEESVKITQQGADIQVIPGRYRVMTGRRLENGTMVIKVWHVNVNENTQLIIEIPEEALAPMALKSVGDYDLGGASLTSLLTGRDFVAAVRPTHEPSEHVLRELLENREAYQQAKIQVVLVASKDNDALQKVKAAYGQDIHVFVRDNDDFARHLAEATGLEGIEPVLVMMKEGQGVYYTQGYHVGAVKLSLRYLDN